MRLDISLRAENISV